MEPARHIRRAWWTKVAIDLTPLIASPDYRRLWCGQLISIAGSQIRMVTIAYHVYLLTGSSLAVGLIGLSNAIPLVVFSLWGGVVADAFDRRKALLVTQVALALVSVGLALGSDTATPGFLYAMSALGATFAALDAPARSAMIPNLVGKELLPAALSLNQVMFQTAQIAGPAVAGVVIARFGLQTAYWIDAASYLAAWFAVMSIRTRFHDAERTKAGFKSLVEGLRYLGSSPILKTMLAVDFAAMFFGWPRALFPFFAEEIFRGGAQTLGLLTAAPALGALIGVLSGGWMSHIKRQGRGVIIAVAGWGLFIAGFALVGTNLWLACTLLALAGLSDVVSAVFRGTILQTIVPDRLRGRLNSVNLMVVVTGPRFGEVESGALAHVTSPQASVVIGGGACVVAALVAVLRVPSLANYKAPHRDTERRDTEQPD